MKLLGIALIALGALALQFGGIPYDRQETIVDAGPFHATATVHHKLAIPPLAGDVLLVAGVLALARPRGRGEG